MNKLLSGFHYFNVDLATELGIEEAIILQNIMFWIDKNKANGNNKHDGKYWTYNSVSAFQELFPYMTSYKINRVLNDLEDMGYLESGNYNKAKYDRTKWYTITPKLQHFGKSKMELSEIKNGVVENQRPIPDNKPDNKPDIKDIDVADEVNKYKDIFEYYLTFDNLVSHQKYRTSYRKAMQKAERDLSLSAEEMKMIIKRHSEVVELTKNSKNAVKVRTISELFGQKKYDSTILICEDYLDTGSYYKKFIKNHERIKEGSSKDKPKVREVI